MGFIDDVNATAIDPDLLIKANMAHAELPQEDRSDLAVQTICFLRLLEEQGFSGEVSRNLILAINFRMRALAMLEMEDHKETGGWSMKSSEDGLVFVHEDLLRAAALEPLIEVDNQAVFKPNSFFKRLLAISEERGSA